MAVDFISEKTVALIVRLREKCEEIASDGYISAEECAMRLDTLTNIMNDLLVANGLEQKALVAKKVNETGVEACDAIRRMCAEMEKEEAVS